MTLRACAAAAAGVEPQRGRLFSADWLRGVLDSGCHLDMLALLLILVVETALSSARSVAGCPRLESGLSSGVSAKTADASGVANALVGAGLL